jgi:hypothetical protein
MRHDKLLPGAVQVSGELEQDATHDGGHVHALSYHHQFVADIQLTPLGGSNWAGPAITVMVLVTSVKTASIEIFLYIVSCPY